MGIHRRFFLQAGLGVILAPVIHGCRSQGASQANAAVSQELLTQVKKRGHLLIATEDYYPPFEFLVNDRPAGLDHDLLERLRKSAPFEIRQEIRPWTGLLPGVGDGEYDAAITAANITEERAKFLDFTMPIAETTLVYLKRKDDRSIQGIADLSGRRIGVQRGGASFDAVPTLAATLQTTSGTLGPIKEYGSFPEAYRDLNSQQVDVVLNNIVSLSILVNEKPGIFELGEPVVPRSYAAWAVKKGNQALVSYLNQFLSQMRESGELKQLQQRWLKVAFDQLPQEPLLPGDRSMS
ncbi:MAG: transporter substrate-binding domain-containing protein [Kaiparowitsia implicata GSE-PSE-MK54-09C]|jgi:polar amino acid transport system substrate-binding protein|nr:transporter substrate-binding domain-containing protein [Kaiparowitsia implicata GSE-PSE-MK54-09C]